VHLVLISFDEFSDLVLQSGFEQAHQCKRALIESQECKKFHRGHYATVRIAAAFLRAQRTA
jgi:hypothetical protein